MSYAGPSWILDALGWLLFAVIPIAAAVLAVLAWRRPAKILTVLTGAITALALLVAALLPGPAPAVVTVLTAASALVIAVAGGSPVVRTLLERTVAGAHPGANGGVVDGDRELLRGGETIGLLERFAVAGAIIAGVPEALAVVIAIKGVGRFTELVDGEVRERFIIGTLGSWIWAAALAGLVLLTRS